MRTKERLRERQRCKCSGAPGVGREEKEMSAFSHISLSNEPQLTGESNPTTPHTKQGNYRAKDGILYGFKKPKTLYIGLFLYLFCMLRDGLPVSAAAVTQLLPGWQELCAFVFIVVELHSHFSYTHLAHKVPNALFSHLGDGNHFCK